MPDAWFSLGLIYEYTGQQEKAVEAYRKLLEINGDDRQALERLGQLLVRGGNFDAALKIFKRLQDQGEVPVSISIKIALIYLQQGKYKEAAELLQKLHARYPAQSRITFYLASCREAMKERDEALKLFLKIPAGDDLYYDARIHAAFLYEDRKDYAECENILRELIANYPEKAGLYRMLSSLRRKQGDEEGALKILEKARRQFPDDYKIRFALGVVYSDLGRAQDSIRVMQELLKENPDDATVLNFIGYTYVEQGVQLDDAAQLLEKARRLKPDSGFILDSVGWLHFVRGEYDQALDYLKRASAKVPDDPVIYEHLGDTYVKLGRLDEARQSYRHSLKIKASEKVREKLQKLLQNEK
jgi:pentatricopeptide repeat protein